MAQKLLSRHWRLDKLAVDPPTVGHSADNYLVKWDYLRYVDSTFSLIRELQQCWYPINYQ